MSVTDDRDLFLLFCQGLAGSGRREIAFEGSRFGVAPGMATMDASRNCDPTIHLAFSEADFRRAVAAAEDSATSLWPDRAPLRRAIQLMLVHCDEEADVIGVPAAAFIITFNRDGYVCIEAAPPVDEADANRRRQWSEDKAREEARIQRLIDEGSRAGATFEWR